MSTTTTPVSTPIMLKEKEFKEYVAKSTDDKLREELKTCQNHFDENQIVAMNRTELLAHVSVLRRLAGSHLTCKTLMTQFKPDVNPLGFSTEIQTKGDQDTLLSFMKMIQQQQLYQQQQQLEFMKNERELERECQARLDLDRKIEKEADQLKFQLLLDQRAAEEQKRSDAIEQARRDTLETQRVYLKELEKQRSIDADVIFQQLQQTKVMKEEQIRNAECIERARVEDKSRFESRLKRANDLMKTLLPYARI